MIRFSNALQEIHDFSVAKRMSKTIKTAKGKKYKLHIQRLLDMVQLLVRETKYSPHNYFFSYYVSLGCYWSK